MNEDFYSSAIFTWVTFTLSKSYFNTISGLKIIQSFISPRTDWGNVHQRIESIKQKYEQ